jgi:lipopolysaccharide export system protein LptA
MRRLRFFKVLLPVVLALVLLALVWAVRPKTGGTTPVTPVGDTTEGVTDVQAIDRGPDGRELQLIAGEIRRNEQNRIIIEDVSRAQIWRPGADPLEVISELGDVSGEPGSRQMLFEEGVTLRDPAKGIEIVLPRLEVDEAEGVARADAEVGFHGEGIDGRADGLVYYLEEDRPSELHGPRFDTAEGARLSAAEGLLHDGLDDVELLGDVRGSRGNERFVTGRLRLRRDEQNRVRSALAAEGFAGYVTTADGTEGRAQASTADIRWDESGDIEAFDMTDGAEIHRAHDALGAVSIAGELRADGQGWRIEARGNVWARGRLGEGSGWLRTDTLDAVIGPDRALRSAEALGNVRFEGEGTRAEADRATFESSLMGVDLQLFSTGVRKALLERDRARVAGRRIRTDPRGESLTATGQVEATLLPAQEADRDEAGGGLAVIFDEDEAVHFVSDSLQGRSSGDVWIFTGDVRGWQGERNLSADRVEVDQSTGTLSAAGAVNTRVPRQQTVAASEADYLHIAAGRLNYDDGRRLAVYRDEVRVRMAEGWLESGVVEVEVAEQGGIAEVRAGEAVTLEFRDASQSPPRILTGTADRMRYVPAERIVWMYGDNTPATVRRLGEAGGVTRGRVLRYELDEGVLEVESGGLSAPGS